MAFILTVLALLAIAAIVIIPTVGGTTLFLDRNRKSAKSLQKSLRVAERALSSISSGADSPALIAQIALDEIEVNKELN